MMCDQGMNLSKYYSYVLFLLQLKCCNLSLSLIEKRTDNFNIYALVSRHSIYSSTFNVIKH